MSNDMQVILGELKFIRTTVTVIQEKVNELEAKVDKIESKVDKIETKVDRLEGRVGHIEGEIQGMNSKMDVLESNQLTFLRELQSLRQDFTKEHRMNEMSIRHVNHRVGDLELEFVKLQTTT